MPETPQQATLSTGIASCLLRASPPGGQVFEFYIADGLTIGRSIGNTICVKNDPKCERQHARVVLQSDGSTVLSCLTPTTRIVVDDREQSEVLLSPGVRFRIGLTEFECLAGARPFSSTEAPALSGCPFCGATKLPKLRNHSVACPTCNQSIIAIALESHDKSTFVVPANFGRYMALEFVARGGMGLVLRGIEASQPNDPYDKKIASREVAIKLLFPNRSFDSAAVQRFRREIGMLKEVKHPNVLPLLGYGRAGAGKYSFLVTPWVAGHTLRDFVSTARSKHQLLRFETVLEWFNQACQGLQAIHAAGIVHRDIKPSNLLVGDGRLLIADFGIARKSDSTETSLTTTGEIAGTLEYMSPEQSEAPDQVNQRTDIYSLGVVFYELLTRERPVGAWQPPSQLNPSVPAKFDNIFATMLARAPERRFDSIQSLLSAIQDQQSPATTTLHNSQSGCSNTEQKPKPQLTPTKQRVTREQVTQPTPTYTPHIRSNPPALVKLPPTAEPFETPLPPKYPPLPSPSVPPPPLAREPLGSHLGENLHMSSRKIFFWWMAWLVGLVFALFAMKEVNSDAVLDCAYRIVAASFVLLGLPEKCIWPLVRKTSNETYYSWYCLFAFIICIAYFIWSCMSRGIALSNSILCFVAFGLEGIAAGALSAHLIWPQSSGDANQMSSSLGVNQSERVEE